MAPHILFLTRTAYTLGGAATWLDYLEPGLRARGWRVTVGLVEGKQFHRPERYLERHPHQEWARISCTTGTRAGRREALQQALRALRPDLIISMNVADAVAVVATWRAQGQWTPRMAISAQMIDEGLCKDIADFSGMLDAVVCTNALTRQLAMRLGGMPAERVCYGPYGVAVPTVVPPATPRERLHICYVGRLDWPDKRVYDIPGILAALDTSAVPFELTVIGTGPDEAEFQQRLQPWLHNGSARLLGRLAPADIWARVHPGSGVLLLTSWTDTGPFVVFEAMAWQLAVVSSMYYGSGLEQALRHQDTAMLFPIGDAAAAAHCLQQLWTEHGLHQRLVDNGTRLVHNRYALQHSIVAWDGIFRSILDMPLRHVPPAAARSALPAGFAFSVPPTTDGAAPGENDEWPLTLSQVASDNPQFWRYVAQLDAS